jgi:AcrR family transcriptional regulator
MARSRTASVAVESALLDAARRLLAAEGVGALSVRRIATEAGVAPMGVYSRFGDKHGIIEELFIEGFRLLTTYVTAVPGPNPLESIRNGMAGYRLFALENGAHYSLMFDKSVADFDPPQNCLDVADGSLGTLVQIVERGIADGLLRDGDPLEIAQRIWAAGHGAVSLELRGIGFVDNPAEHYQLLVETMVRGLSR